MKPFRTILHGTCLLGGRHPAGSKLARECPVLRRQERQKQRKPGSGARTPVRDASNGQAVPASAAQAPTPGVSRQRRYRAQHPEYQQREADRKARRRDRARFGLGSNVSQEGV
jgi:hypothetical protein